MKLGDPVRLRSNPNVTGTISKLPTNSAKRKRARLAVVDEMGTEMWFFSDEVEPLPAESAQNET